MFVIVWVTLLFCVRGSNADKGASLWGESSHCLSDSCIKLNEGEITAEAGLCAVIPCSFIPPSTFQTTDLVWMKCDQKCDWSVRIFHTDKSRQVLSRFKGRVSLLEPDVSLMNCSIIINDLTESDSGSYQFRIVGKTNNRRDDFTFPDRANVSVKELTQKPTVMVPPLTAGQQTTLTCIAPGLCSGSEPEITWMRRGAGENNSHIIGNITVFKTESLTSVTQRHSSTLTFNASAEHHDAKVTCKVSFMNNISTEETVTLNVTYMRKPLITGKTSVEEGHAVNLTCSVQSFPPSRITWTKLGSNTNLHSDPDINMSNNTESSTLVIHNMRRDDPGRYICTAEYLNKTVPVFANITVTYIDEPKITGNTSVEEGHALNLTCSVKSFPLSRITWTKFGSNTNLHSDPDTNKSKNSDSSTLFIQNATRDDSGRYICTAEHLDKTVSVFADITVTYMTEPVMTGKTSVEEGHALNLTCSVKSFPLSRITWTKHGSSTNLHSQPDAIMSNNSVSATLFIQNVTRDNSGRYICTADHLNKTMSVFADITVTWFLKILQNSECKVQLNVLTCVCITEGFPLPTIKWPLLKNHTEYSVMTTVSDHTLNSTITLSVKDHSRTTVECVSVNENGEVKEDLIMTDTSDEMDKFREIIKAVSRLEVIIAFLSGLLSSAVICCLIKKYHRSKQRSSRNLDKSLEMVTSKKDNEIDPSQTVDDDQTNRGAVAAKKAALNPDGGPEDPQYASIDFSLLRRRSPRETAITRETTETEYAEVKEKVKEEREDSGKEEAEFLEVVEEEVLVGEDEDTKQCAPEQKKGEDTAVYSNINDIISVI